MINISFRKYQIDYELDLLKKIEKLENALIELTKYEENYLSGCDITRALKKSGIISD